MTITFWHHDRHSLTPWPLLSYRITVPLENRDTVYNHCSNTNHTPHILKEIWMLHAPHQHFQYKNVRIASIRYILYPCTGVCCLLSAVCCLLSAICCLLSAVCYLLSVVSEHTHEHRHKHTLISCLNTVKNANDCPSHSHTYIHTL
jgi:hypothetical protein